MLLKFYKFKCALSLNVMILIVRITHCKRYHHEFFNQEIPEFPKNNDRTGVFHNEEMDISSLQNDLVESHRKIQNTINAAEDRSGYYHNILNRKRREIRWLKRELKRCRHTSHHNLKFIRKSDDDRDEYDTIRIKIPSDIPYGFQSEYFPRPLRNEINTGYYNEQYKFNYDDDMDDNRNFKSTTNPSLHREDHTHSFITPKSNKISENNTYYSEFVRLRRQPIHSTRFQSTESIPRQFSSSRQSILLPKRPRINSTRRISRQRVLPVPYQLKEAILRVSPSSILTKENAKYIDTKKVQRLNTNILPSSGKDNFQIVTKTLNYNPNNTNSTSFNETYIHPHYSNDVIKSNTLKIANTETKKYGKGSSTGFVNIIPTQWIGEEINYNTKGKLKLSGNVDYTDKQHFVKDYVGSKNNWMPVTVKYPDENGNDKSSMREQAFHYVATLPSANQQQIPSVIRNTHSEDETRQMLTRTTKELEIITAKYPLEDKNNIPNSTKQNKPTLLITKENMREFYPNGTLIFFNIANDKKTNTENVKYKGLNKIPNVNSDGIRPSRLNNISVLVSGSMLVKEN